MNILFICTANRLRSLTAEHLYRNDKRFNVKSAGTHTTAGTPVDREILEWADIILVMEKFHEDYIKEGYPHISKNKKIFRLDIPDRYEYMDPELVELIRTKCERIYNNIIVRKS